MLVFLNKGTAAMLVSPTNASNPNSILMQTFSWLKRTLIDYMSENTPLNLVRC